MVAYAAGKLRQYHHHLITKLFGLMIMIGAGQPSPEIKKQKNHNGVNQCTYFSWVREGRCSHLFSQGPWISLEVHSHCHWRFDPFDLEEPGEARRMIGPCGMPACIHAYTCVGVPPFWLRGAKRLLTGTISPARSQGPVCQLSKHRGIRLPQKMAWHHVDGVRGRGGMTGPRQAVWCHRRVVTRGLVPTNA